MWLTDARRKGLTFYVSSQTIGKVSFEESTWFTGFDEKMFYGKGAFYQAAHPKTLYLWILYFALRTRKLSALSMGEKFRMMHQGAKGYRNTVSYSQWQKKDPV